MARWRALTGVATVLAMAVALAAVPLAMADGDPASDILYGGSLFPSYDSGLSAANLKALQATIDDSKKAGYEVRVALIAKRDDMGSVTVLWAKPREYARFLGTELGIVYKGPVLIVMPNGLGFYHGKRDPAAPYAALKTIKSGDGLQLAEAANSAVAALARQSGHPFTPHAIPASSSSGSRIPLIAGVGGSIVIVLALVGFLFWWRRPR